MRFGMGGKLWRKIVLLTFSQWFLVWRQPGSLFPQTQSTIRPRAKGGCKAHSVLPTKLSHLNSITSVITSEKYLLSKLVYIGAQGAFRKNLGSVGQKWISEKVPKGDPLGRQGVESLRGKSVRDGCDELACKQETKLWGLMIENANGNSFNINFTKNSIRSSGNRRHTRTR